MVLKSGMYDRKKPNMPKTWRVCFLVTGRGISTTAGIRSGSGSCIPDPTMWPTYLTEFLPNSHLPRFSVRPESEMAVKYLLMSYK